jgi:hypothetical protein
MQILIALAGGGEGILGAPFQTQEHQTVTTTVETTTTPPVLMSVCKAERVCGLSKAKLCEWIGDGRPKARFVGKFMRVHRDDMAAMSEALPKVGE